MERIIEFFPAYDKRDPDPTKNYGIHGVNLRFLLKGDKGTIQFVVHTNWMLPHVQEEHDDKTMQKILAGDSLYLRDPFFLHKPTPADLGYHSPTPVRDYQKKPSFDNCEVLGVPCYYDGSTSNAEPVFKMLLAEGDAGVWAELEDYYKQLFGEEA